MLYQTYLKFENPLVAAEESGFSECRLGERKAGPQTVAEVIKELAPEKDAVGASGSAAVDFFAALNITSGSLPDTDGMIVDLYNTQEAQKTKVWGTNPGGGFYETAQNSAFVDGLPEECEIPEQIELLNPDIVIPVGTLPSPEPTSFVVFDEYYDSRFDFPIPFYNGEGGENGFSNTLYTYGGAEYAFFIPRYESKVFFSSAPENLLPHMYTFSVLNALGDDRDGNAVLAQHVSLGGAVDANGYFMNVSKWKDKGNAEGKLKPYNLYQSQLGQYYDLYAGQFQEALKCEVGVDLNRRYRNVMFSYVDADTLLTRDSGRHRHPMYFNFEFSTEPATIVAPMLEKTHMFDLLMLDLQHFMENDIYEPYVIDSDSEVLINTPLPVFSEGFAASTSSVSIPLPTRKWDMKNWLTLQTQPDVDEIGEKDNVVFMSTNYKDNTGYRTFPFKTLYAAMLQSNVQDVVEEYARTFDQVANEMPAYSETLFYKIDKIRGANTNGEVVQSTFIPNTQALKNVHFYDTQVKYAEQYTYVMYAYQFVISTEGWVSYMADDNGVKTILSTTSRGRADIVEVPMYIFSDSIHDDPPVAPTFEFWPYQNCATEVLLAMNSGIGEYRKSPTVILAADETKYEKIAANQKSSDGTIRFSSDDVSSAYQVWTLPSPPKSIDDFALGTMHEVMIERDKDGLPMYSAASMKLAMEPNEVLYLVGRSYDVHLNPSDVSEVFKLRITQDGGTSYFEVEPYDMEEGKVQSWERTVRRKIKVKPSLLQMMLNFPESGFIEVEEGEKDLPEFTLVGLDQAKKKSLSNIPKELLDPDKWGDKLFSPKFTLGPSMDSVWGKEYKLRVRSKETGKVLDINFSFDYSHEKDYSAIGVET